MRIRHKPWAKPELEACDFYVKSPSEQKGKWTKLFENPVIASLPKYENSDCYYGEGFQDYTDYCKYYFSKNDTIIEHLKENKYFKSVTANDVEEVKGYF